MARWDQAHRPHLPETESEAPPVAQSPMIEAIVAIHPEAQMQVRDGMSEDVLSVGPGHTLRQAASAMSQRQVGAAIVLDPEAPGPGVITERDILRSVGAGEDPDAERVADHLTARLTFAAPDWSLEQAAAAMVRGGFRHLIVVERDEILGMLSMRDIVRCWTEDGATSEVPAVAEASG
jgi:CBS domain-containing protein